MASQGNLARPSQTVALQSCIMDRWFVFRLLRACMLFALCALVFVFVGGLPIRQGVVLGAAMVLLAFGVLEALKPAPRFISYWVRVSPNWYQILADFKLVGSIEE